MGISGASPGLGQRSWAQGAITGWFEEFAALDGADETGGVRQSSGPIALVEIPSPILVDAGCCLDSKQLKAPGIDRVEAVP